MISTNSILVTAIFVFSLMFIGIVLTAIEFKAMRKEDKSEPVSGDETQDSYYQRHSVTLLNSHRNKQQPDRSAKRQHHISA